MKRKALLMFIILFVNFFTLCLSVNVNAQATYNLDVNIDDEFIWEIKELNLHNFKKVFGFEPTFEKGDQTKKKIVEIISTSWGWSLVLEEWDYKSDLSDNGTTGYNKVYKSPGEYEDNFFIPTPVEDYLSEADLGKEYIVEGSKVTKRTPDYDVTKEYDWRGVVVEETYVDDDGIVLIKVEGTFRIPFGNYFIGFMVMAITAIIYITIKRNKIQINRS